MPRPTPPPPPAPTAIRLEHCREHNLADLTVEIPHGALTVVTGVSGSGKSSLVFDTLHAAAQRRFLETLSGHARRFLHGRPTPRVGRTRGLSPTIALSQRTGSRDPRSTVGTLSGLHDLLRYRFAAASGREPRDFSFVTAGACPTCRGFGQQDEVVRELLVADPSRTLREGALVPTTPTGYIVYSQVTVDALDTVCRAHGFDVDTPWRDLTPEQQDVVFFGSDRVEVPFGKHPLESRMRWEGIQAKPRELGHYKGIVPTIADTLRRNRNENALRFARSVPCTDCGGSRLSAEARAVEVGGASLADLVDCELPELAAWIERGWTDAGAGGAQAESRDRAKRRVESMLHLGLAHLRLGRGAPTLSGGEYQRTRLATLATAGLAGVTFVFDEPSIGLHASEEQVVLDLLRGLRDAGNTVVVVEHSAAALRAADHVLDLGPGAGPHGGELLFAGAPADLDAHADVRSATRRAYGAARTPEPLRVLRPAGPDADAVVLRGVRVHQLRDLSVRFPTGRLTVVAGVAGAGKSTLVHEALAAGARARLEGRPLPPGVDDVVLPDGLRRVVAVGQEPIGRTPRSNAATYTGLFDAVRKMFSHTSEARARGFDASTFSFNAKKGGRCPECEGAGREVVGMHGLPDVERPCPACGGRRFRDDVLEVRIAGRSVLDVLESTVDEARALFARDDVDAPPALGKVLDQVLDALQRVGLGYLTLGQPATTLSGGEAQRVRLAGELAKADRPGRALVVLDEPTVGLHREDTGRLVRALDGLTAAGHTVVVVEHDLDVVRAADHVVELGPGAGHAGGRILAEGTAAELAAAAAGRPTGRALAAEASPAAADGEAAAAPTDAPTLAEATLPMHLHGVSTHNLRDVDVAFPVPGLTVVTGVSGSGKSSLVFDSLYGESTARMTEHLSSHVQRQLGRGRTGRLVRGVDALRPAVGLAQRTEEVATRERRSTVATAVEIHPLLRLLWSRAGEDPAADDGPTTPLPAEAFSWFRREGACPSCAGTGAVSRCDPERLLADPERPLFAGGLDAKNRIVRPYADPEGRYRAVLEAVGHAEGIDFDAPWSALDARARDLAMHGAGEREYEAVWTHTAAEGKDAHTWRATWRGLAGEIDREYARKQEGGKTAAFEPLLVESTCPACLGERLGPRARAVTLAGRTLPDLCRLPLGAFSRALDALRARASARATAVLDTVLPELHRRAGSLVGLGLGHLTLDRPTATLSAGERQRLRLGRQLGEPLHGVAYVLDEPTLGLHPADTERLLGTLRALVDAGNAVVAVEHDPAVAAAADHVVEVGPGPGPDGGRIVAAAPPGGLPSTSRTARVLARHRALRVADGPRRAGGGAARGRPTLGVRGAHLHHLADVDVDFPVGALTAVAGVSGSGKTTLVRHVLAPSVRAGRPVGCRAVELPADRPEVLCDADARLRRARNSCPATWLGAFDDLRKRFAATDLARTRGYRPAHFAFASGKGGTCKDCGGTGRTRAPFDFLGSTADRVCETCGGARYDAATLEVTWLGLSIADVLELTVDGLLARAGDEFTAAARRALEAASRLGLGYVRLGQGTDTLSGGEAQRLFLAQHLARTGARGGVAPTLFVLDEPTRGLHPDDVDLLVDALTSLVEAGHTVVAVEHDLALVATADHVVDLGPGAGEDGGRIVFQGLPADLARTTDSATGRALAAVVG